MGPGLVAFNAIRRHWIRGHLHILTDGGPKVQRIRTDLNKYRVSQNHCSHSLSLRIKSTIFTLFLTKIKNYASRSIEEWAVETYGKDENGVSEVDWVFQQDGATCHTAGVNQEWVGEHYPGFIDKSAWPAKSPDLTVPDYYVWGRLKELVNAEAFSRWRC